MISQKISAPVTASATDKASMMDRLQRGASTGVSMSADTAAAVAPAAEDTDSTSSLMKSSSTVAAAHGGEAELDGRGLDAQHIRRCWTTCL